MNQIITEKDFPIREVWILKPVLPHLIMSIILLFIILIFPYYNEGILRFKLTICIIYFCLTIFILIDSYIERTNFHFILDKKFLTFKQGLISKKQRNFPYGVIQSIFIKQDLFDRIFGLASLTIENAAQGAGAFQGVEQIETVGFIGNKVVIPGLAKADAQILKNILLQKIKENPIEDSQSGL